MILTAGNLRKRNITYIRWCFMCKSPGKYVDHFMQSDLSIMEGGCQLVWVATCDAGHSEVGFAKLDSYEGEEKPKGMECAPLIMWVI